MARTPEQFIAEMKEINQNIDIVGTYTKSTERIKVRCLKCNKIWEPKAYSLLQGKGCPSCAAKRGAMNNTGMTGLKTTDQFISDLKVVDDSIQVIGAYQNGHTNISVLCSRCGHSWEAKPYSLLQGHGCPRCAKSGTSFMEQLILLCFQESLGQEHVYSRDKKTIGMELDIYIPKLKIAFEPGNWWLHKRSIKRDEQKRTLCAEKGIRLITIYDNYPKYQNKPFEDDIYTFTEDLNNSDHSIIRNLVTSLFMNAGIKECLSDEKWAELEQKAYENAKAMSHEDFVERMSRLHPLIQVKEQYKNANIRLLVKCKVCGYEWNAVPANLLSGDGCRKCGTKKAHEGKIKEQELFISEVARINPDVEVLGTYTGRHSPIKVRCKICGMEWYPIAASILRGSTHKGSKGLHKKLLGN